MKKIMSGNKKKEKGTILQKIEVFPFFSTFIYKPSRKATAHA